MKHLLFTILIAFAITNYSRSQVTREWVQIFNGPVYGNDEASSIAVDNDGNVYVTGISEGVLLMNAFITIKYNSAGIEQWQSTFDGAGSPPDYPKLAIDNLGNVYVTGPNFTNGKINAATVKYDSSGTEIWRRYFSESGTKEIKVDNVGNVYVAGTHYDSLGVTDFIVIKYNTSGELQWSNRYGTTNGSEGITALDLDNSGNAYVTGYSFPNSDSVNMVTIKYDPSGDDQWVQIFDAYDSYPKGLAVDNSGNSFVVGYIGKREGILKYNTLGIQEWVNIAGGGTSVSVDDSGNVFVTGTSYDSIGIVTRKYNFSGIQQWIQKFNGFATSPDATIPMTNDSSGNVYISCVLYINGTNSDYATVKYSSAGVEEWIAQYNSPHNSFDEPKAIVADNSGNVYVTGYSQNPVDSRDYATIKYSQHILLSVNMFIEGFYDSQINSQVSDTINVLLRDADPPYMVIDSAKAVVAPDGSAVLKFNNAPAGKYYIVLKHRNSIETWSKSGGEQISLGTTSNYDFTHSVTQAFGNNMKEVDLSPVRFAVFSGDVNQDGVIDASDLSLIGNAAYIGLSGYVVEDLSGDNFVDASDLSIVDRNSFSLVQRITPLGKR